MNNNAWAPHEFKFQTYIHSESATHVKAMSNIVNTKFIHPLLILCFFVYRGFHYIMLKARKVNTINNCLSNIKPNKIDKTDPNFLFTAR